MPTDDGLLVLQIGQGDFSEPSRPFTFRVNMSEGLLGTETIQQIPGRRLWFVTWNGTKAILRVAGVVESARIESGESETSRFVFEFDPSCSFYALSPIESAALGFLVSDWRDALGQAGCIFAFVDARLAASVLTPELRLSSSDANIKRAIEYCADPSWIKATRELAAKLASNPFALAESIHLAAKAWYLVREIPTTKEEGDPYVSITRVTLFSIASFKERHAKDWALIRSRLPPMIGLSGWANVPGARLASTLRPLLADEIWVPQRGFLPGSVSASEELVRSAEHQLTLRDFVEWLQSKGIFALYSSRNLDLVVRLPSSDVIVEVKTTKDGTFSSQFRLGIGQLLDYRRRYSKALPRASLLLVFNSILEEDSLSYYTGLARELDIDLCSVEADGSIRAHTGLRFLADRGTEP